MSTQNELPIGVFDSGVGGLTVLRRLMAEMPTENFIYLGDTARLPYGTKSKETVTRYTHQACQLLIARGIKCLVVACNTASTLALDDLILKFPNIPIVGVVAPGAKTAVKTSPSGKIAIIATEATVKAGGYQHLIRQLRPDAEVYAQSCQLFVALAEEGWLDGPIVTAVVERYFTELFKHHRPDTLVLGCTHFPALLPTIKHVIGNDIHIIDSAFTTALEVKQLLQNHALLRSQQTKNFAHFLVTDSPQRFHQVAKHFLQTEIELAQIELVDVHVE